MQSTGIALGGLSGNRGAKRAGAMVDVWNCGHGRLAHPSEGFDHVTRQSGIASYVAGKRGPSLDYALAWHLASRILSDQCTSNK
jgi:hypothetical protein